MTSAPQTSDEQNNTTVVDKLKQWVGAGRSDPSQVEAETPPPPIHKFNRVHIIVNPASGQTGLNLPALNKVLQELNIDWEMFVTRRGGDAYDRAKQAIEAQVDAVVVYGGDGTVLEAASALSGSSTPLIILPGGTANVLAAELGIPADQTQAALLMGGVPNTIRAIDMAALSRESDADLMFFHLGIGLEGTLHQRADREKKDRSGMMAYVVAALKSITNPTPAHYRLTLDGETVEVDGINCMITNYGSVGVAGLTLSHAIDVSDGLLDVIVIRDVNITSLLAASANAVTSGELAQPLLQWQAREITITADPLQPMAIDGELVDVDSIRVRVVPQAVQVVIPATSA